MSEAMESGTATSADRKWKVVYTIVERPASGGLPVKKFWIRLGTAFINHDSSMNVRLDAMPTNGLLHIRDPEPYVEGQPRQDWRSRREAEAPHRADARATGGTR